MSTEQVVAPIQESKKPELRFGVLRPLGSNLTGQVSGQDIDYEDLWKHDQYIHDIQFKDPQGVFNDQDKEGNSPTQSLILKYQKIKEDQNYTCAFCGFIDKKYIEIHHKDGNHFNNSNDNLQAACILCHRQHHLLWLALCDHAELGAANVDYLPQTELNHLQRISFVMTDHPNQAKDLGKNGKLGAMLSMISNNFSRPLHAFMVSDKEKFDFRERYIAENDVSSPFIDKKMNFKNLVSALQALSSRIPDQKEVAALEMLDAFIPPPDQNTKPEEHRAKYQNQLGECIGNYEKDLEKAFETEFEGNKSVFTIFELAIALKSCPYKIYKDFNPPFLKLIFKPSIFTPEQITYYKKLGYFNTSNWKLFTDGQSEPKAVNSVSVSVNNDSK